MFARQASSKPRRVAAGRAEDYARWFDGAHQKDLARLRGFRSADRYEVTPQQIMPDIPQPWRFLSVYEFDYAAPEIDLPALAPLLADVRDAGLIDDSDESERIHSYAMYSDWVASPNHQADQPFSGVSIILANCHFFLHGGLSRGCWFCDPTIRRA